MNVIIGNKLHNMTFTQLKSLLEKISMPLTWVSHSEIVVTVADAKESKERKGSRAFALVKLSWPVTPSLCAHLGDFFLSKLYTQHHHQHHIISSILQPIHYKNMPLALHKLNFIVKNVIFLHHVLYLPARLCKLHEEWGVGVLFVSAGDKNVPRKERKNVPRVRM